MCRIDAPYVDQFLDEKAEPSERFFQALDECRTEGVFQDLLTKHFSKNWKSVFGSVDVFEEALKCALKFSTDQEKCGAFLSSDHIVDKLRNALDWFFCGHRPASDSALLDFTVDIARTIFPESPYSLYSRLGEPTPNYGLFVTAFYEESFCFSPVLFNDPSLTALGDEKRTDILWRLFEWITRKKDNQNLSNASSNLQMSDFTPPGVKQGIEFLKEWVRCDAKAGRLLSSSNHFFGEVKSRLCHKTSGAASEKLPELVQETRTELEYLSYYHFDLSAATTADKMHWARDLKYFLLRSQHESSAEGYRARLTQQQHETRIQFGIKEDFQNALRPERKDGLIQLPQTTLFLREGYFEIVKERFQEELSDLDCRDKLRILSAELALPLKEFREWLHELQYDLGTKSDFPKDLVPRWTILVNHRLDPDSRIHYIDKSIGILRGMLSSEKNVEDAKQLKDLLNTLLRLNPSKSIRHRLMLMRSSNVAFSDESIKTVNSTDRECSIEWYMPMREFSLDWIAASLDSRHSAAREDPDLRDWSQEEALLSLSHEFAEFCLSRLRLRKGEKAENGRYDSSQVIESSPVWRQGYLKALTELGFDLGGKVHKTVNFIKQSDPDEDVQAIAKECYRSVRRDAKKNPSIQDLKRGIISAEWWLLICQRRELGLPVIYEEALKTRRRLLRNP